MADAVLRVTLWWLHAPSPVGDGAFAECALNRSAVRSLTSLPASPAALACRMANRIQTAFVRTISGDFGVSACGASARTVMPRFHASGPAAGRAARGGCRYRALRR